MSPPTGTGNHGANALPVRGNVQVEAPEGPHRRAPERRAEDRANDMGRDEDDVGWVSLGGSLFSDWTQPITGEPIPRSNLTSLGGSLFSDRTEPITGEPIPRSSTSGTSTRRVLEVAPIVGGTLDGCGGPSRQVLEVALFVPGPIRNRGSHTNRGLYYYYYLLQLEWL